MTEVCLAGRLAKKDILILFTHDILSKLWSYGPKIREISNKPAAIFMARNAMQ
jgi:hypothetical protein